MTDNALNHVLTDPYGAEQLFIKYFISDSDRNENYQPALEADFPVIAREFFRHEKDSIDSYSRECTVGADIGSHSARGGWRTAAFELIYIAARNGSRYSRDLLRRLYRTYYHREYNNLKRYRTITKDDLLSLCEAAPDADGYDTVPQWENGTDHKKMARLLIMAGLVGIDTDQSCRELYDELAGVAEKYEKEDDPEPFPTNQIEEEWAIRECMPDLTDPAKFMSMIIDERIFTEKALQYYGYRADFVDTACPPDSNIGAMYGLTNLILKKAFPGREFDRHEFGTFFGILHAIQGLNGAVTDEIESFNTVLGLHGGYEDKVRIRVDGIDDMDGCADVSNGTGNGTDHGTDGSIVDAVDGATENSVRRVSLVKGEAANAVADTGRQVAALNALKKEIERLQLQLQKAQKGENHYRELYENSSRQSFDAAVMKQQYEAEHAELIALRDHVYSMTEMLEESSVSLKEMEQKLRNRKLVIVGGNSNWVQKLKELFPDWVYVGAGRSGTTDEHLLDHADFVYFFTDTMSHSVYYRFIQMVRIRDIPFAYIHGVNIELNVKQMYREVVERG